MIRKYSLAVTAAALALAFASDAWAHEADGHQETVTPLFSRDLPNVPGKTLLAVEVTFPPGGEAAPHRHPASAFLYAYVLSGEIVSAVDDAPARVYRTGESWYEDPGARHTVTRNASPSAPAKLLVIFVVNPGETELVRPLAGSAAP